MTRQQALALLDALEGQRVPATLRQSFDAAGATLYGVEISPEYVVSAQQLGQLVNYCTQKGLILTAVFSQLGVVA